MKVGHATPQPAHSNRPSKARWPWWAYAAVAVPVTLAVLPLVFLVIEKLSPGLVDTNPIRDQPYYHEVIGRIASDANFRKALGAAPVIREREISCSSLSTDSAIDRANCFIPVSGPRGSGEVHARIVDLPNDLKIGLWLHLGGSVVDATR